MFIITGSIKVLFKKMKTSHEPLEETDQRINSWLLIRRERLSNLRVLDGALIVISFGGLRFCGLVPGF